MIFFRNTPAQGAIAHLVLALALAFSGVTIAQSTIAQTVTRVSASPVTITAPNLSPLTGYYRQMQAQLVGRGYLRQNRNAGGNVDAATLARNFMAIAMRNEYSLSATGPMRSGASAPLRRWEQPVRIGVRFGASVGAAQQRADLSAVRGVAQRLQRATLHPVSMTQGTPNFFVLVLSDTERANAGPLLAQIAPNLSRGATNAITRMRRDTFCMVIATPSADPAQGYVQAIAVVRAELPPLMRQSCIEEELAQGMGLCNDSDGARPSIFNDDEEFGVLTRHDELLLRMLYDDNLSPGMSPALVSQRIEQVAAAVLARS
jgi:Protein of unknown function (DUF2927)